jgi:DNA-binding SARP family transcriptional activator
MNGMHNSVSLLTEVFDQFPDGIVIIDRTRRILARNEALGRFIAREADAETCCELFGCGREGTPLEGTCMTEIVATSHGRVRDIVLELGGAGHGVRITPVPLYDRSRIIYQVRSAVNGHEPPSINGKHRHARLSVQALGPLRVTSEDGSLTGDWVSQRPGQLFKFLLTERHRAVPVEAIADGVWQNASFHTRNTVRHCVHLLRTNLEPEAGRHNRSPYIVAEKGGYRLNRDLVSVDVDEFEKAATDGLRALDKGDSATAVRRFKTAVELYGGDYLEDEPYAEWTLLERERLRDAVTVALRALAELCSNDTATALAYLERLAAMEPFDPEIQRQLMGFLIAQGRRTRAARQYQIFEQRLIRAYGERPGFRLTDVDAQRRVRWERPVTEHHHWVA